MLCYRPVSIVRGKSQILRLFEASPCVPTVFSGVQQGRRGQRADEPIAEACFVCFEPKIGENRPRNGAAFVKDCAVRGAVVGMGDGDVKVEGGVERDVCGGAGW